MPHIIAIGGGEHAGLRRDGTHRLDELAPIDRAILAATGVASPRVLLLAHAQPKPHKEQKHFSALREVFAGQYGLAVDILPRATLLHDPAAAVRAVLDADILYECGGDTVSMLRFWRMTGFDRLLEAAWHEGKVLCGVSAGGNCWFDRCSSKALPDVEGDPSAAMKALDGLGFVPAFFVPHANVDGRLTHLHRVLREGEVAVALSDCAAIEIADDTYRILHGEPSKAGFTPFALRVTRQNGEIVTTPLAPTADFLPLAEFL